MFNFLVHLFIYRPQITYLGWGGALEICEIFENVFVALFPR
jgi:hypothetical protein